MPHIAFLQALKSNVLAVFPIRTMNGSAGKAAIGMVFGLLLAACGADRQPEILIIPSPTDTPFVASPTASPSPTVFHTATQPPASPTPFPTLPPTQPISLEGNPIKPTFTPLPATQTATFSPTIAGIQIEYFVTNVDQIIPGDAVTLFWRVTGISSARIFRLNSEGQRTQFWDVGAEGRLTVSTDSTESDEARFMLRVQSGAFQLERELTISTACPFAWFVPGATSTCADNAPLVGVQVEQSFEGGRMIWIGATQEIYVVFNDGVNPAWLRFSDNFETGMPENDPTLNPPPGMSQPVRGFGLIWRENPAVRDRLGWGLTPETAYQGTLQTSSDTTAEMEVYATTLDGSILHFQPGGAGWEVIFVDNPTPEAGSESPTPAS